MRKLTEEERKFRDIIMRAHKDMTDAAEMVSQTPTLMRAKVFDVVNEGGAVDAEPVLDEVYENIMRMRDEAQHIPRKEN